MAMTYTFAVIATDDATGAVQDTYGPLPVLEDPDPSSLGRMNQYGAHGWQLAETHTLPAPNTGIRVITLIKAEPAS